MSTGLDLKKDLQQLEKKIERARKDFVLRFEVAKNSIEVMSKNLKDRYIEMIDHVKAVAEDGLKEIFQAQEGKQRDLLKRLAEVISKVKQLQGGNPETFAEVRKLLLGFHEEMKEVVAMQHLEIRTNNSYDLIVGFAESSSRLFYLKQLRFHPNDLKIWIDESCPKMKDKTFYALASVFGEDGQTEDCMGLEKVLLAVIIDSKAKTHPAKIEPLRQNNRQVGLRMWFVPTKGGPYEMHVTLYSQAVPNSPLKFEIEVPIVPPTTLEKSPVHVRKEMLTIDDEDGDVLMINEMMDLELIGDGDSMPKAQTSDLGSQMAVARDRGSKRRTHSPIHAPEDAGDEKRQRISPSLTRFRSGSDVKTLDLADYVHFGNPKAGIKVELLFTMGETRKGHGRKSMKYTFQNPQGCKQDEQTQDFLLCDMENHVVKIYDGQGGFKQMTDVKIGMDRPSAVLLHQEKRTFFVKDDHQLYEFDSRSAKLVSTFGEYHARGTNLYGLAQTSDGMLVTIGERHNEQTMLIYDSRTGGQIDAFRLRFADFTHPNPQRWSKFRFIDSYGDKIAISDYGVTRVFVCDVNSGDLWLDFGRRGRMAGEMFSPSGITFDGTGNMLVADSKNQRIQLYDKNGCFICPLLIRKDMGCPSDIHLTSDGKLIVSSRSQHFVGVFQLKSKY